MVPSIRVQARNDAPVRSQGDYVLYWMTAARRPVWNFALQRAAEYARTLDKPLVVFEPLRVGYPWASDRLHVFILQGMLDNARRFADRGVTYLPYVEPEPGGGRGLLESLAERACVVVTDDFPTFFLPRMVAAAAKRLSVRLEVVDGNGLLPMRAAEGIFSRAHDFRRFLQKQLQGHLRHIPEADPLRELPHGRPTFQGLERWLLLDVRSLDPAELAASLPIDHAVVPAVTRGGFESGEDRLRTFVKHKLARYEERNHPDADASSGLSPYLHFGQVSAHEVLDAIAAQEGWTPDGVAEKATGSRQGWWKLSAPAEGFLDELVTWRELGFNMCWQREDCDTYESLPAWARATLEEHAGDGRTHLYTLAEFESARTHDELWNATQRELVREGRVHNYLRMLWGKNILAWSESPKVALSIMLQLNDKYALDGRDPNSISGIFWVLGRYDRAWGPERPVFGKIRYMTSSSARNKLRLDAYLARYAGDESRNNKR